MVTVSSQRHTHDRCALGKVLDQHDLGHLHVCSSHPNLLTKNRLLPDAVDLFAAFAGDLPDCVAALRSLPADTRVCANIYNASGCGSRGMGLTAAIAHRKASDPTAVLRELCGSSCVPRSWSALLSDDGTQLLLVRPFVGDPPAVAVECVVTVGAC